MAEDGRGDGFTEKQQVLLSPRQKRFLAAEVQRRKEQGVVSEVAAAHGGNKNLNQGMLIREALEAHFNITPVGAAT